MPLVTFGLSVIFYKNSLLQKAGTFYPRIDAWQGILFLAEQGFSRRFA
jgi:hypothetical protein